MASAIMGINLIPPISMSIAENDMARSIVQKIITIRITILAAEYIAIPFIIIMAALLC